MFCLRKRGQRVVTFLFSFSINGRCFDIGNTVAGALASYCQPGNPSRVRNRRTQPGMAPSCGSHRSRCSFASNPKQAIHYSGKSSRTTHGTKAAVNACRYFAGLLVGALRGKLKAESFREGALI